MLVSTPPAQRFVLHLLADGRRVREVTLSRADFHRAIEATFFEALRNGKAVEYAPPLDSAKIEPRFKGTEVEGFDVVLTLIGGEQRGSFGLEYFKNFVRRTGAQLAVTGTIASDATLVYRLGTIEEPPVTVRRGFTVEMESEPAIAIRDGSRKELGPCEAWHQPGVSDFPVVLPRHVVEESVAEARRMPDREVGGVLLGHLRRDRESGELYLEVTCLVPAEQTEATALSVTFTHNTWARVREVAQWRGEGELIVGWMHSHPFRLCAECPSPVPTECQAKVLFYSADDEFLMESTFARPFMVGLLAAVEPRLGELPVKLFGWRNGVIVPRGFEVMDA